MLLITLGNVFFSNHCCFIFLLFVPVFIIMNFVSSTVLAFVRFWRWMPPPMPMPMGMPMPMIDPLEGGMAAVDVLEGDGPPPLSPSHFHGFDESFMDGHNEGMGHHPGGCACGNPFPTSTCPSTLVEVGLGAGNVGAATRPPLSMGRLILMLKILIRLWLAAKMESGKSCPRAGKPTPTEISSPSHLAPTATKII